LTLFSAETEVRRQFTAHNSLRTIHRGTIHRAQFTEHNSPRTIGWVFLQFCRNWSRLTLKKLWWDLNSISAYLIYFFWFVGSPEALKFENSHMKVKNWSCPIHRYGTFSDCKLLADSKNVKILLFESQFQPLEVK
jgi:hypothetical protein